MKISKSIILSSLIGILLLFSAMGSTLVAHADNPITVGYGPQGVALAGYNNCIYVTNTGSNTVSVIITTGANANTVIKTIAVGKGPQGIASTSSNDDIYVANSGDNTVSVIDPSSNSVVATITSSSFNAPDGVAYAPSTEDIYVTNSVLAGTVSVIATTGSPSIINTVVATITVGGYPTGIAYAPSNEDIYVANNGQGSGNAVSVIATTGATPNTVVKTITGFAGPQGVAYAPSSNDIYVANNGQNTVSVIDASSNTVLGSPITVGWNPCGVVYASTNDDIYVTLNEPTGSVITIATTGATPNTIIGSPIAAGIYPCGIAFESTNELFVAISGPMRTDGNTVLVISTLTQCDLRFAWSGLDSSAGTATIVSVTIGDGSPVNVPYSNSPYDFGLVAVGTTVTYTFSSTVASSNTNERFVLTTPDASPSSGFTLYSDTTVTGTYNKQYKLTMATNFGTTSPVVGDSWHDASATVSISATAPTSGGSNERYTWAGWAGSGTGSYVGGANGESITMNGPITETASWLHQWRVTFTETGLTSDAGGTVLAVGSNNYAYVDFTSGSLTVWAKDQAAYSWTTSVPGVASERFTTSANSGTVTDASSGDSAAYQKQWQASFQVSGLDSDAGTNTVITVDSTTYAYGAFPIGPIWINDGATFTYESTVAGASGERFLLTSGPSGSVTFAGTWSATYQKQYDLQFAQSGLDGSALGTIVSVTIDSNTVNVPYSSLPYDYGYVDSGTTVTYTFTPTVASSNTGEQFVLTTPAASPASGFTLDNSYTVTGTYKPQYQLTVATSGLPYNYPTNVWINGNPMGLASDGGPYTTWLDNPYITGPIKVDDSITGDVGYNYVFTHWSDSTTANPHATETLSSSGLTLTAYYKTQYDLQFAQSGLDSSALGTIVSVTIDSNTVNVPYSSLPYDFGYVDSGTTVSYSFTSPVPSSNTGEQFVLTTPVASPPSGFTLDNSYTVTGTYSTQQLTVSVTITSSPAGSGFVKVDGVAVKTPKTFTWAIGSAHTLQANSPVSGGWGSQGLQYVYTSWSNLGSQTQTYTVPSTSDTVTANYKTQYQVTFKVKPSGAGTTTPSGTGWEDSGSLAISATLNAGYTFTSWSSSTKSITFASAGSMSTSATISGPGMVTANFAAPTVSVTITSSPAGSGFVEVDGAMITNSKTFTWTVGSTHTLEAESPVSGGSGVQYVYTSWSDGGAISHSYTVPSTSATVTANYKTQYQVSFKVNPTGAGTTTPSGTDWEDPGSLAISATLNIGYSFTSWSSNTNSITFDNTGSQSASATISGPGTITANFAAPTVSVIITSNPSGSGFVKVDGVAITTSQTFTWAIGSTHTLQANSPVSGGSGVQYVYTGWSDGGGQTHTYTVSTSETVTATYKTQYYLTLSSAHDSPQGAGWYDSGKTVSFSVKSLVSGSPGTQYVCTGYSGGASGTGTSGKVYMSGPETVTFAWKTQYRLTVNISPSSLSATNIGVSPTSTPTSNGRGSVYYWFDSSTTVTLTANTISGYRFSKWSGGASGTSKTVTVKMSGPMTVTATYTR